MTAPKNLIPLPDLLRDPARVAELPDEQVPTVLSALAAVHSALAQRMLASRAATARGPEDTPADAPRDRMLTAEEAAPFLGVAPRWLYRHAARLPFARRLSPKAVRFSEAGLRQWLARQKTLDRAPLLLLLLAVSAPATLAALGLAMR